MFSLMVNKERNVLLPAEYHETTQPYEDIFVKLSKEFIHELHSYANDGDVLEFKLSLMNHINSLMDLYEEL